MSLTRRSFFKRAGAALVTAFAAPMFIPAERLDFGVPKQLVTATSWSEIEPLLADHIGKAMDTAEQRLFADQTRATAWMRSTIPVTLLQNEFLVEYGGRLEAGRTVMVDSETASSWIAGSIAVAAPGASNHLQQWSTSVQGERQRQRERDLHRQQDEEARWQDNENAVTAAFAAPQWTDFGERMQETERQRLSTEDVIGRLIRSADRRVVTAADIFDLDEYGDPIKKAMA